MYADKLRREKGVVKMSEETLYPEGLPEAPASLNFYGVTQKGWNLQVTLRDDNEQRLFKRFAVLAEWMEEHKISPKPVGQQPQTSIQEAKSVDSGQYDWMRDGNGDPVIDKGKMILLVDGGADVLPNDFKVDCPLHSGKRLFLNDGKYGKFLGHKMDTGGYCNANIHARIDE